MDSDRVPLPLTVTWGTLPELVPEALAWSLAGVAAAVARAAEAAVIAIAPFMVVRNEDMSALLAIGELRRTGMSWSSKGADTGYPKRKWRSKSDYEGVIRRSSRVVQGNERRCCGSAKAGSVREEEEEERQAGGVGKKCRPVVLIPCRRLPLSTPQPQAQLQQRQPDAAGQSRRRSRLRPTLPLRGRPQRAAHANLAVLL